MAKAQHKPRREVGIAPTPERLAKGDLVAGYTVENTRVYGDRIAMNPPLIDTLLERGWIDARTHGVAANYANLLMREGPAPATSGRPTGAFRAAGRASERPKRIRNGWRSTGSCRSALTHKRPSFGATCATGWRRCRGKDGRIGWRGLCDALAWFGAGRAKGKSALFGAGKNNSANRMIAY
jgi:hypothetical protein